MKWKTIWKNGFGKLEGNMIVTSCEKIVIFYADTFFQENHEENHRLIMLQDCTWKSQLLYLYTLYMWRCMEIVRNSSMRIE